jgi:hypothetical protein
MFILHVALVWHVGNGRSRKLSCKFTTKLVDKIFGVSYINTWFFSVIPVVTASKLHRRQRLRWSSGSVLAFGTEVRPKNPTHFLGRKNPQHAFLRRGSKAVGSIT